MFLDGYLADLARLEKAQTTTWWTAANSGKPEDFDAAAKADLALKQYHSDPSQYAKIKELLAHADRLDPMTVRSLQVAELAFRGNQLPAEMLEKLVRASSEIEQIFTAFRGQIDGKPYSNNDLLEMLAKQTDSAKRKQIWEALKQVGGQVGPKLVTLAKMRNDAARQLGFANYWDMQVRLQEHEPERLLALFDELEALTNEPFRQMKADLDKELAPRFGITPDQMMPWHYDNPFFQDVPPSDKVNLDEFYQGKSKEDIVRIAQQFYADLGIAIDDIIARSDLYDREGKNQHAFCIAIDRQGDVRVLTNIKPNAEWMDTILHEQGHAVYYKLLDFGLPYNLREAAHIFTTEAVAMMFGAASKTPSWLTKYAGADPKRVEAVSDAISEQRRREQLVFTRWTIVMLRFEKALYENPDQDLNKLWWDVVEKTQLLKRPPNRNEADWASKPHFAVAPVYYHNYMLGELFAAQLRATLARLDQQTGPTSKLSFNGKREFGRFLTEKIFRPGMRQPWPQFVKSSTGEELTAKHFAAELQ